MAAPSPRGRVPAAVESIAADERQPRPTGPRDAPASTPEVPHLRSDPHALQRSFLAHVQYTRGQGPDRATPWDKFQAIAMVGPGPTRRALGGDEADLPRAGLRSARTTCPPSTCSAATLGNNLIATGLLDAAREGLRGAGVDLDGLIDLEPDAGLGNGGLGRLAACFLDSMATHGYPGMGYGIRYEFGIFRQDIIGGHQVERADEWLKFGNPWEMVRPEKTVPVRFYGAVERGSGRNGAPASRWVGGKTVLGVPYDMPVAGYGANTVNTLRLWQARASEEFDFRLFNDGDYERSVVEKNESEVISKVLYPNDQNQAGKELRLRQEYFFVACSLADIVRRYLRRHEDFGAFPDRVAIQLNDTHPAVAIAELMRLMVDEKQVPWDEAWEMTVADLRLHQPHPARRGAGDVAGEPLRAAAPPPSGDHLRDQPALPAAGADPPPARQRAAAADVADRGGAGEEGAHGAPGGGGEPQRERRGRSCTPSCSSATCSPTSPPSSPSGSTTRPTASPRGAGSCCAIPACRRSSPRGSATAGCGTSISSTSLEPLASDAGFLQEFRAVKQANKQRLVDHVRDTLWVNLDPTAIFDVQVKRLHEYKRQLLNALHIVALWIRARENPAAVIHPRVFLFGAKAAPGYVLAKLIIRLINGIAEVVNADSGRTGIQVVFLPNYRVSLAERIIPAADVSEQISTAGQGGLGHREHEVRPQRGAHPGNARRGEHRDPRRGGAGELLPLRTHRRAGGGDLRSAGTAPREVVARDPELKAVLDLIRSGFFSPEDPGLFHPLVDALLSEDPYLVLADFRAYADAQLAVARAYAGDPEAWSRKALLNVARVGRFSSDRSIHQYAHDIWRISSVQVTL